MAVKTRKDLFDGLRAVEGGDVLIAAAEELFKSADAESKDYREVEERKWWIHYIHR
jgi:hypothetical protein